MMERKDKKIVDPVRGFEVSAFERGEMTTEEAMQIIFPNSYGGHPTQEYIAAPEVTHPLMDAIEESRKPKTIVDPVLGFEGSILEPREMTTHEAMQIIFPKLYGGPPTQEYIAAQKVTYPLVDVLEESRKVKERKLPGLNASQVETCLSFDVCVERKLGDADTHRLEALLAEALEYTDDTEESTPTKKFQEEGKNSNHHVPTQNNVEDLSLRSLNLHRMNEDGGIPKDAGNLLGGINERINMASSVVNKKDNMAVRTNITKRSQRSLDDIEMGTSKKHEYRGPHRERSPLATEEEKSDHRLGKFYESIHDDYEVVFMCEPNKKKN